MSSELLILETYRKIRSTFNVKIYLLKNIVNALLNLKKEKVVLKEEKNKLV